MKSNILGGAALFAAALTFGPAMAHADILIGAAGPMTGQYAAFGQQLKEGAQQAIDDINAHGGVLGQKLKLIVGDDACDPKQAVSVANMFAARKVALVDGHFCSSSSIPASKVYADNGILEITPASTNPDFTDKGGWNVFRTCGRDDQQGIVAGAYLAKEFKGHRIAILDDNSTYGKGLADQTRKNLNKDGTKEVFDAHYVAGEKDYSALVSRLKQARVDVIYIGGYHPETGLIARQAKEQGMHVTIMGGDALVTKEYWQITGPAGEGTLMTFPPDPRLKPTAAAVVKEFNAKKIDPEGYVLYTYAAIQEWAQAAKKAGTIDPRKVATTLRAGTWDTVLGPISYDKKGDIMKADYVMYIWHNGNYSQM